MRTPIPMAFLALAACQPAVSPVSVTENPVISSAAQLVGEYRVASVDGGDLDLPQGITASVTDSRLAVQSDCIRLAFDYRLDGPALALTPAPVPSCRRGLSPAEQAIQGAFTAAVQVARTPDGGVQFTGNGRSVTLFSQ